MRRSRLALQSVACHKFYWQQGGVGQHKNETQARIGADVSCLLCHLGYLSDVQVGIFWLSQSLILCFEFEQR